MDKNLYTCKTAGDLKKGEWVANLGIVDAIRVDGVFIIAAVRGTVWSTAIGKGDIVVHDVTFHVADMVIVQSEDDQPCVGRDAGD